MYIYIYIYIHICIHMYMYRYAFMGGVTTAAGRSRGLQRRRECHNMYQLISLSLCVYLSLYIYISIVICMYIYIYIYIHTHIHPAKSSLTEIRWTQLWCSWIWYFRMRSFVILSSKALTYSSFSC